VTETADRQPASGNPAPQRNRRGGKLPGRQDWSTCPHYQAAGAGFRGYWYPVGFSSQVGAKPHAVTDFQDGVRTLPFYAKYLGAVRWLFHGQFSGQDEGMVEVTDAPPEKLYRLDDSLLQWRKLAEDATEDRLERLSAQGLG